ncbi:L-rhamnose-binding lectin CSL2-like [Chanos chanos]|uniref:L-rhamnose-binding lectin CSL2-like n=1 Tax=Chanos chanos TaxID=29144 RepID=A0A6J2W6Q1_CHACN|nr:L-rhamnose-binding lectin CSL2-like [Chanos chanos]
MAGTETVITCYGLVQRLSCEDGVIIVQSATYGRTDAEICSSNRRQQELANTDCSRTVPRISDICNGKKVCEINPHTFSLPDPCFGTYKYFTTIYTCVPTQTSVTCEGGYSTLDCGSDVIEIISANYGRTNTTICSTGRPKYQVTKSNCFAQNTVAKVAEQCDGKSQCSVRASNSVFSDTCAGTYKYLNVTYSCSNLIKIYDVIYGRSDRTTCAAGHKYGQIINTDCSDRNAYAVVAKQCNGKNKCLVHASNSVFSDPCPGTSKYLIISHSCKKL